MGIIGAIGMVVTQYFWTVDWWRPLTITNTRIGIEDALLGFNNAGIAAVLYEEVFRRQLYKRSKTHDKGIIFLVILTCILFIVLFIALSLSSFNACIISLSLFSIIMMFLRRDLLLSSLINGLLMTVLVLPIYYLMIFLSPNIIENTYLLDKLSGIRITGIPIEELIFYFIFGSMVGLVYEFWHGLGLRRERND